MNLARTLNQLGGYVQDEVSSRRRTLRLLEEQEASIQENDPRATAEAVRKLEREMSTNTERLRRRARLLGELAHEWNVSADLLTLGSIIERGGAAAAHLRPLRDELRKITATVIHKNRLLSSLIGMHRRVIRDVIEYVLEDERGAVLNGAGTLIDAEA